LRESVEKIIPLMSFKGLFRLMEGNGVEGKDVPSFGLQKEKRREKA